MLAVVLAGALVTYGGVSLFVAFFVLAPMAEALFRAAAIPRRLMPAAIALGTSTFTMSALPGTPAIQNAIPMPFFGTTPFAAPGLGMIAAAIMLGFGLWWLGRAEAAARRGARASAVAAPDAPWTPPPTIRWCASGRRRRASFDPAEIHRRGSARCRRRSLLAALPLAVVVAVNLLMSFVVLPRLDTAFLAEPRWGVTSLSAVGGVWSVAVALAAAIVTLLLVTAAPARRCGRAWTPAPMPPCCRPSVSRAWSASAPSSRRCRPSLVRDWVLGIGGGPLVSLAVATNVLSALTGSASGGLTIALDALGPTYMRLAAEQGIDPALLHRVAVIGAGTLDSLPHNGAVVTLLAVCGSTHAKSYFDIVMVGDRRSPRRARRRHRAWRPDRVVLRRARASPSLQAWAPGWLRRYEHVVFEESYWATLNPNRADRRTPAAGCRPGHAAWPRRGGLRDGP